MGAHDFSVDLHPDYKLAVDRSGLTGGRVDAMVQEQGRAWLDCAGFSTERVAPGSDLRVGWGRWGPEHITVPGNSCGLDILLSQVCQYWSLLFVWHVWAFVVAHIDWSLLGSPYVIFGSAVGDYVVTSLAA